MSDEIDALLRKLLSERQEANQNLTYTEEEILNIDLEFGFMKDDINDIKWDVSTVKDNQ